MRVFCVSFALLLAIASPRLLAGEQDSWQILAYPEPWPGVPKTYCYGIYGEGDMVGRYLAGTTPARAYLLSEGLYYAAPTRRARRTAPHGASTPAATWLVTMTP
jgi:hypothetical protein